MHLREAVQTKRIDPLLCDLDLPLSGTFYPAGFPLHLATNSRARAGGGGGILGTLPARVRYARPWSFAWWWNRRANLPRSPRFASSATCSPSFPTRTISPPATCLTLSASFHLSEATAADHAWLRWFYLEAMAYMLLTQRYVVSLHAACVARDGAGILICGKSAAGKSTLSFACARAGFTYVSDDCTWLLAGSADPIAIGKPHQVRFRHDAARHFPEVAGYLASRASQRQAIHRSSDQSLSRDAHRRPLPDSLPGVSRSRERGPARVERMPAEDVGESLLADMPSYGPEVNAMHEKTIHGLAAPARLATALPRAGRRDSPLVRDPDPAR